MSVVIVGGNECMAGQYESICREHGCKAKVFTKENGSLRKKVGTPYQHRISQDGFERHTGGKEEPGACGESDDQ